MDDPTTMTLDEIRDWAATYFGWRTVADDGNLQRTCWINERYNGCPLSGRTIIVTQQGEDVHPIPATLDAIAGLMPPDWVWFKHDTPDGFIDWLAKPASDEWYAVKVDCTGNELLDRARLAMLATLAEDKHKEPRT